MAETSKTRIYWIDNLRALAIINMVIYHAMWDLVYIYGVKADWYRSEAAFIWQQFICWTFILLSGFCSNMSRKLWKHGLTVSFWGIVIMAVTQIFMPENGIWFGVLTLIGCANLLLAGIRRYMDKVPAWLGFVGSFLMFVITYSVNNGYVSILGIKILQLPGVLYQNLFTAFLGFPTATFYSTDYFPMIPWLFLFFTGVFAYRLYQAYKPRYLTCININIPAFTAISKYSLAVYVLHQPIIYGILEIIF